MRLASCTLTVAAMLAAASAPVQADMVFSTHNTAKIGGLKAQGGDAVSLALSTGVAELIFTESEFGAANEQLDALHVLSDGCLALSTANKAELAGLEFDKGDLVRWDPVARTASLMLDHRRFAKKSANIDAVYVRDNGNIVLSASAKSALGGLAFGDGDLIEYDPISQTVALLFDGSGWNGDINAVHILDDGDLLLSVRGPCELYGQRFGSGDVIRVNQSLEQAGVYADDGTVFSGQTFGWGNLDALSMAPVVPEPATMSLLAIGGLLLLGQRLRRA